MRGGICGIMSLMVYYGIQCLPHGVKTYAVANSLPTYGLDENPKLPRI